MTTTATTDSLLNVFAGLKLRDIEHLLARLTPDELREIDKLISDGVPWHPLPGPQTQAYNSTADVIGYGGAAGGGKTDLAIGLALTKHKRTAIMRREATQLLGVLDRIAAINGSRDGYNGQERVWRGFPDGKQIEFGSTPAAGDEVKYQGRAKDLLVLDEATNFLESQVRFLMGWVRTTDPDIACQTLLTFNPPTSTEGRWIIPFFGPWLDRRHAYPAAPGELRWVVVIDGTDVWLKPDHPDPGRQFVIDRSNPDIPASDPEAWIYDFDPAEHNPEDIIKPQSRTFIPSRVSDNPYLMGTGYLTQLQSLPEPLRSQMLNGDFSAGMEDDPWQVIPTAWVEAAMARWRLPERKARMSSMGVDVARGGRDSTTIARRHGAWYDAPIKIPGKMTPDGPTVAGQVMTARRDLAPVHIDVIGVGASPYDFLKQNRVHTLGVNVAEAATTTDRSGRLKFANLRAQLWWQFREDLDPANGVNIALPPDSELLADLCAPCWLLRGNTIAVESREDIIKRIGRSPDLGTAYILARIDTASEATLSVLGVDHPGVQDRMGAVDNAASRYDPYSRIPR